MEVEEVFHIEKEMYLFLVAGGLNLVSGLCSSRGNRGVRWPLSSAVTSRVSDEEIQMLG